MKRILLLSPTFYGMWRGYVHGFTNAGFDVSSCRYDDRTSMKDLATYAWEVYGYRVRHGKTPFETLRRRYSAKAQVSLLSGNFDAIVVFSGALLDTEIFSPLRNRGVPVVMWLEDQLDRLVFLGPPELRSYAAVATFSKRDAAYLTSHGVSAHYVPFGFDELHPLATDRARAEVAFIGARDSYRTRFLEDLVARGVPIKAYGQQWSRNPVFRIRERQWSRPNVPGGPRLSYQGTKKIYQRALASLNLHVPSQDLMNPRTFDIAGVGGLQLTDRTDVDEFYEPGKEVLVFRSVEEAIDLANRATRDPFWARQIRAAARRRTLAEHTITQRCREVARLF